MRTIPTLARALMLWSTPQGFLKAARANHATRPLKIQTVAADGTLTDGARVVKLYTMTGFDHTVDMLMVYLP